jgi:mono/diheme cytochrome c family protein
VGRYAPRLKSLEEAYRGKGVRLLALNVAPSDSVTEAAWQAVKAEWAFPVGKDFDGKAAKALGATRTPEVVVLDSQRRLVYRGRIDDQLRLSGSREAASREDLKEALEDVLAGREVRVAETPVDGCLIEFDALAALPAAVPKEVTFARHVAPIFAKHCQECHRPETSAPFSLLSFKDARDHAETIAEVVRQERMPPAFCSREQTEIVNARRRKGSSRTATRCCPTCSCTTPGCRAWRFCRATRRWCTTPTWRTSKSARRPATTTSSPVMCPAATRWF